MDNQQNEQAELPTNSNQVDIGLTELSSRIEAILLSIERPITAARIAETLGIDETKSVNSAINALNDFYDQNDRSFRVEKVAGGYQMLTLPQFKDDVGALNKTRTETKLSPAALETLAIIAYKQPALRAEIESVRGVSCGEMIRSLMDKHLVKITGRADEIGRPLLYGTTKTFLELFGLSSIKDLPKAEELTKP